MISCACLAVKKRSGDATAASKSCSRSKPEAAAMFAIKPRFPRSLQYNPLEGGLGEAAKVHRTRPFCGTAQPEPVLASESQCCATPAPTRKADMAHCTNSSLSMMPVSSTSNTAIACLAACAEASKTPRSFNADAISASSMMPEPSASTTSNKAKKASSMASSLARSSPPAPSKTSLRTPEAARTAQAPSSRDTTAAKHPFVGPAPTAMNRFRTATCTPLFTGGESSSARPSAALALTHCGAAGRVCRSKRSSTLLKTLEPTSQTDSLSNFAPAETEARRYSSAITALS
mmetsp:Transcript_32430/g.109292  ORF Transcript_32430/g.109292 Transcript_32430/m.109292 type:complete len:289 (+) Transcript_32430:1882-2748(+)